MRYIQILGRALTPDEVDFNFQSVLVRYRAATGEDMPVTLRRNLARALTNREVDQNFLNLDQGIARALYGDGPYPVLDARFDNGASLLDPRFTFTRAGDATYIDDAGVLRTVGPNVPVFEGGGLRLRPQETNVQTYSENLAAPPYAPGNATVQKSDITAPDGTGKFYALIPDSANTFHRLAANCLVDTAKKYTVSFWCRAAGYSALALNAGSKFGALGGRFNLATGEFGYMSNGTGKVLYARGGVYRIAFVSANNATSEISSSYYINVLNGFSAPGSDAPYQGNGADGILLWGLQVNEGGPIPYIPTAGSAVTRPVDLLEIKSAAFADAFNPAQGAVLFDLDRSGQDLSTRVLLGATPANQFYTNVYTQSNLQVWKGGVVTGGATDGRTPAGRVRYGIAWDGVGVVLYTNGVKRLPVVPASKFDASLFTRLYAAGTCVERSLRLFRQRPSDAQMTEMTS